MEHIICREQLAGMYVSRVSSLVVHSLHRERTTHNRTACCTAQPYLLIDQATAYGPWIRRVDRYSWEPGEEPGEPGEHRLESRDQPEPSGSLGTF